MSEKEELEVTMPVHVRRAFQLLKALTDDERALVMCWFCDHYCRYVGPGDWCHCADADG